MNKGLPSNFESLSRLEALREAVGSEIAFWSTRADALGGETTAGQAALEVMDYWAQLQQNMWSDETQVLDSIESALHAAKQSRVALREVA